MHRDAGVGIVLTLLGGFLLWQSGKIPTPPFVPIGPAFYPRIILGVFVLLTLALVASGLARRPGRRTWSLPEWLRRYRVIILTFVVFGLYTLALPWFGFLLSTFLFTVVVQWVLGRWGWQSLPGVLAVGAGTALGTYLVFEVYLKLLLPRGTLF
ncbi:MAG: tripartite tricarboxylate transporter TctB family protein [Candidatus Rokubacteria bacterium]|nr:tripartite tricarboxylate transporter TctB family protein [Candidatus Rokubacteria bacterium]